jgi:hypothetical protein
MARLLEVCHDGVTMYDHGIRSDAATVAGVTLVLIL